MCLRGVAAGAACAVIAGAAAANAEEAGYGQPSCIASTLPAAAAQARLIPAEIKGAALGQVRGVVVRALAWKQGETIKVCFHGGTRKAQERVARLASQWMQYANVVFDFEQSGTPRLCQDRAKADIKVAFEDNKGWWSVPGTASRAQDPSMNLQFYGVDTPMLANGQPAPSSSAASRAPASSPRISSSPMGTARSSPLSIPSRKRRPWCRAHRRAPCNAAPRSVPRRAMIGWLWLRATRSS